MVDCPYCGKDVKESDKFCLFCGEPLLFKKKKAVSPNSTVSSSAGSGDGIDNTMTVGKNSASRPLFPQTTILPAEIQTIEDELKSGGDDKPFVPDELDEDLDPKLKDDIQARIDYYHLSKKIKIVKERLKDSIELLEDPDFKKKYDYDDEFRKKNATRIEALRQIGEELKERKQALESKMMSDNPLQLKNMEIKRLKNQIVELNNSFRMKRIERKAFDKLHQEYKSRLRKALATRKSTNIHLGLWVSGLKTNIEDLKNRIDVLKARKASKEINKKEFKGQKEKLEKEIKKITEDIKIVEKFVYKD
ncbi:MAG: zinc-ribbon domain-containing protein [Promethearchaeota archaeon]